MFLKSIGFVDIYLEVDFLDELLSLHIDDDVEYFLLGEVYYINPYTELDEDKDVNISLKDMYELLTTLNLWDENFLKLTVREFLIKIDDLGYQEPFYDWYSEMVQSEF